MANLSEDVIQKVWEKGRVVLNNDSAVWRQDECGAWIGRKYYGNRDSQYGWEIDHISPGGPIQLAICGRFNGRTMLIRAMVVSNAMLRHPARTTLQRSRCTNSLAELRC